MADFIWLAIITAGKWILKNIGPQILLSLGIGLVSYTGFSALQSNFSAYINAMGSNLSQLDALLHILGVFAGIKIFLSAVSIKFSLSIAHRIFPVKASS
ncbi:MAG: DUF2523 family protein [Acidithiobacillus caldus]|uniref:DUF2523 family protein n=1 Tax=Acidithiobacillus caldus TaxID=33059 RepID=UPI0028162C88|nr:DUF2523 family protein [Acidithiobacillus caldus]WMT47431.1 MAG: DUF2523 family protein [Acidithiobacillus caldus]